MKKVLISTIAIFALIGCGGGSSNNDNNSNTTNSYKGAVTQGDYATFTFNSSTLSLTYNVDSSSYYYPGVSGTVTLANPYGKFYTSSTLGASAMIANNILIGKIPQLTSTAYVVGLQNTTTPTASDVAGKTYIYTHIDSTNNVTLHTIQVNANGTYSETNLSATPNTTSNGCWKIMGGRLVAKDGVNDCSTVSSFDFNVVIKPGTSRSGIVVDYIGGNGIGIGLEQQLLTNTDVAGTYLSYFYETTTDSFAKAIINNINTITWQSCPGGSCTTTTLGTLTLNKDCSNNNINGVACATFGTKKYLTFIDNVDNYYIAVSATGTPFHVEVGAK